MRAHERKYDLVVNTGFPATSILLLICAAATATVASTQVFNSKTPFPELWWAVLIVVFVMVSAWLLGEATVFIFSKTENRFSWSHGRLFVKREGHMPLTAVIKARRDILQDSEGDTYRLVIETSNGIIPLTNSFGGNEKELSRIADQINRFVSANIDAT